MSLKFRPCALMGFITLAVLISSVFFSDNVAVVAVAVGVMIFVVSLVIKQIREKIFPFYIAGALIVSGALFTAMNNNDLKYAESFIGQVVEIEGTVTDEPSFKNSRYYYVLDLESIDGNEIKAKLRLSLANDVLAEPYDRIKLKAKVYEISAESKDVQLYFRSKGIFLGAYAYNSDDFNIEIIKRTDNELLYKIYCIREEIKFRIFDKLPNDNGATVIAMLLGDKSDLPQELNEKFREAGIAPIFAVSGLHLSVWVMGLYGLLNQLGVKRRVNSIIGICFTVFFMLLTGLSPSVCRSGLMLLLLLSGNLFYRRSDSLNSLGFAALVLCFTNPYIVADTGFLMSFFATLGIVVLMPVFDKNVLSKIPTNFTGETLKSILSSIAVSISASVGVFPITVYFIGYISIFSVLTNLLVTYVATVCMLLGGLTAITYDLGFISDFLSLITGLLTRYLLFVVDIICKIPVTTITTDNYFWKAAVAFSLAVLLICTLSFKGKALLKSIAIGMTAVILTTYLTAYFYYDDLIQVRLLDVDNGVSVIVSQKDSAIALTGEADSYYKSIKISENLNQIKHKKAELFVIGDMDGANDFDNLQVIQEIDFKKVVLPHSSESLQSVCTTETIIETDAYLIETWESGTIKYVINEDYSLAYCEFFDTEILILFNSKKKAEIPKEFLTADFLVCSDYIPNCISPKDYVNVIVCGDEETSPAICSYVNSCGGSPLPIDGYNDLRIDIRDKSYKFFALG